MKIPLYCACSADSPFLLVLLYALKSFCLHIRFPAFEFIIDREKDGIFGRDLFEVVNRELFFSKSFFRLEPAAKLPFFRMDNNSAYSDDKSHNTRLRCLEFIQL